MIDIVLYSERILSYPPHTILEMIDMNNRKFDIKITPFFTGVINYTREDYITGETYYYSFRFIHGELSYVAVYLKKDENPVEYNGAKFPSPTRFNGDFWVKAPKYLHFDDCKWERQSVIFDLDVTCQPFGTTCII